MGDLIDPLSDAGVARSHHLGQQRRDKKKRLRDMAQFTSPAVAGDIGRITGVVEVSVVASRRGHFWLCQRAREIAIRGNFWNFEIDILIVSMFGER
jgi:hypothetical protein